MLSLPTLLAVWACTTTILAQNLSSLNSINNSTSTELQDITNLVPSGDFSSLYPPYNYFPSSYGNYQPHPHGSPVSVSNGAWTSPPGFPFSGSPGSPNGPPGLPLLDFTSPSTYWYEQIQHNGISPFIKNGNKWQVYRNVKDFGAKGDGTTDDTEAILAAVNYQNRGPGGNGKGTTGAPAVVYFPAGTYLISNSIPMYVDTILMGNPISRPTLLASPSFINTTMVTGFDPAFDAPTNFYMSVKNLIFDSRQFNGDLLLLDWGVSQATQLTNCLFHMPKGSTHTGVSTVQGGSGTMMGDLEFQGGAVGLNFNNQQYSIKGLTFKGCSTAVLISHGFDIVFQDMTFENCGVGINATAPGEGNVGSYALLDSTATNVPNLIFTKSQGHGGNTNGDDSVVIENLSVTNVQNTVVAGSKTILTGGVPNVWVYGNAYLAGGPVGGQHDSGVTYSVQRDSSLLANGQYFTMPPPTYQEYDINQVINIKNVTGYPVLGDGKTVCVCIVPRSH